MREGGSTITQQYARLISLNQEKSLRRKIQEAFLALRVEATMSKDEILLGYLNTAYFGAGAYGVDAAARRYFGKGAKALTLPEAAMLAGLVRAPSQLAPTRNFGGAKERADVVLQAMVETGAITAAEADKARAQTITLRTPPETPPGTNYFLDMVSAEAKKLADAPGDVTVRTTLNLDLQSLAEGVVARRLDAEGGEEEGGPGRHGGAQQGGRDPRPGGRARLRGQPVQPRHPGQAPGRLAVQALRLPHGLRERLQPRHGAGRPADPDRRLGAAEFDGPVQGRGAPAQRLRAIDQHGGGPARRRGRHPGA